MSLNCNEIDLILQELDLKGSFIQEIVQPSFDSLALYTYKPSLPKTVFISLLAGECRLNEVKRKITKNEKPLRFNELLRSKLKGSRITDCKQINKDRIIKISLYREGTIFVMPRAQEKLAKKNTKNIEEESSEELDLYIRLWSGAANIFLCNKDGTILDCFYRRPAKSEVSGEKFKIDEIENQTQADEKSEKQAFQKFKVRDFLDLPENLSFNEKIDLFYSQANAKSSLENLKEQAEKWYNTHKSRQTLALEKLENKRKEFCNSELWKNQGDLILSNSYIFAENPAQIADGYLECLDFQNQKTVRIKIDPKKSAHENASFYYEKYKKQSNALEELEHDIALAKKTIEELEKQYSRMLKEENPVKLEQILRKSQKPKQQEKQERPGLAYQMNGWTIFVGRDSSENDELLRHYVKGPDFWFHTRDYAGGYVFVKARSGKTLPLELMLIAGNLAVYHSKARKNGEADLYYTQVKHLRRAKNGPKGLVLPSNEKNIHIKLDQAILRKLDDARL
ncbi:NFACT RNA binding domain-containing protein [Treponema pectinovorum]|uniref:NFACT RNA binding domain-containing protein n=1 Tax=Treponema pectinovorum TaxID=164 RepID=UPI0011F2F12E|nr:NFACT RNA binding domain-containing protein [Treponema pectinovorum]